MSSGTNALCHLISEHPATSEEIYGGRSGAFVSLTEHPHVKQATVFTSTVMTHRERRIKDCSVPTGTEILICFSDGRCQLSPREY
jgi:hypothetical protein